MIVRLWAHPMRVTLLKMTHHVRLVNERNELVRLGQSNLTVALALVLVANDPFVRDGIVEHQRVDFVSLHLYPTV